jgi:hypothetical protein
MWYPAISPAWLTTSHRVPLKLNVEVVMTSSVEGCRLHGMDV